MKNPPILCFTVVFSSGDAFEMISDKHVVCFETSDAVSVHEDFTLDLRRISQFLNSSGIITKFPSAYVGT